MDSYIIRRNNFKKTQKYKDAQIRWRSSDAGKRVKAKAASKFNKTDKEAREAPC